MSSCHVVFFNSSSPPCYLHSFPTRRSSDLCRSGDSSARSRRPPQEIRESHSQGSRHLERNMGCALAVFCVCCLSHDGRGDRKSTRLNSSHTVISYAVFCLKKKTW